ncbi:ribosome maturation factor RimP [Nocardia mangyaensis]|uniref:Ribosome maturation factor RimP n=1 Tax=Nocardia mangyaensis TaxID=2213200 RepID=A0A1J0VVP4_9NOCA|nr:ribosome maturation factor RimP [Nocardia mangyaensis]APE36015.1 ribosome maturation factor RimP [Nocardia mangyaensis]
MPMPTEERVSQLVAELVARRGFDLEGVAIAAAGKDELAPVRLKVIVDSDGPVDLDAIAELSRETSELLDAAGDFGDSAYLLEVTTPGVDRPLTTDRHWRRAQGRKVKVVLAEAADQVEGKKRFEARAGHLADDGTIALVLGGRSKPHRVHVPLADIASAVVQVEFNAPGAAELELAGGIAAGRPVPGDEPADLAASGLHSDSPTEGVAE